MTFQPPGRIVEGLHLLEEGSPHLPTVILESGVAGSSLSWIYVTKLLAPYARVVTYDRAGLGFSRPATTPRTLPNMVEELRAALQSAAIPTPYILAGHSFGALLVRYFAATYPAEVKGLVFVDAVPASEWWPPTEVTARKLREGVRLANLAAVLAQFGIVRAALKAPYIPKRAANLARELRKLPPETYPILRAQWSRPAPFRATAATFAALPANAALAKSLQISPRIRILALCSDYDTTDGVPNAQYRRVESAGHWIQLDRPDLVAGAILELISYTPRQP